jgi:hypothetical protein
LGGDMLSTAVEWPAGVNVAGKTVALEFAVTNAALYSYWFAQAAVGMKSDDMHASLAPPCTSTGVSYADSFGFNSSDSTSALQHALNASDPCVHTVVVRKMSSPWIIRPVFFHRGDLVDVDTKLGEISVEFEEASGAHRAVQQIKADDDSAVINTPLSPGSRRARPHHRRSVSTIEHATRRGRHWSDFVDATTSARATSGGCPCASASLCEPIKRTGPESVVVFHVGYTQGPHIASQTQDFMAYDWNIMTTIVVFGPYPSELYCHAHSHDVRFVHDSGLFSTDPAQWANATAVAKFIAHAAKQLTQVPQWDGWHLALLAIRAPRICFWGPSNILYTKHSYRTSLGPQDIIAVGPNDCARILAGVDVRVTIRRCPVHYINNSLYIK